MSDRFYGYREQSELSVYVIDSLFSISPVDLNDQSSQGNKIPPLAEFIAYALYRTRLPTSITHQALLLLSRLKSRYPSARGTSTSPHRLFLSSLMLSSKISMDDTYSNKSWQIVGQGLFELREVNQMERELFAFLGWNVVVRDEELIGWVKDVVAPWEVERASRKAATSSIKSISSAKSSISSSSTSSIDAHKRRREHSIASSSSSASLSTPPTTISSSRSSSCSSDEEERSSRAQDAAIAILHGPSRSSSASSSSSSSIISPPTKSSSSQRRRSRQAPKPQQYDSSSSFSNSPASGTTSPGSPNTPPSEGPLTPTTLDEMMLVNTNLNTKGVVGTSATIVHVASW